jgi:hypothetical protein
MHDRRRKGSSLNLEVLFLGGFGTPIGFIIFGTGMYQIILGLSFLTGKLFYHKGHEGKTMKLSLFFPLCVLCALRGEARAC